jgi:hypothetical protein
MKLFGNSILSLTRLTDSPVCAPFCSPGKVSLATTARPGGLITSAISRKNGTRIFAQRKIRGCRTSETD